MAVLRPFATHSDLVHPYAPWAPGGKAGRDIVKGMAADAGSKDGQGVMTPQTWIGWYLHRVAIHPPTWAQPAVPVPRHVAV